MADAYSGCCWLQNLKGEKIQKFLHLTQNWQKSRRSEVGGGKEFRHWWRYEDAEIQLPAYEGFFLNKQILQPVSNNHLLMPHGFPQSFFSGKKILEAKIPRKNKSWPNLPNFQKWVSLRRGLIRFLTTWPPCIRNGPRGGWNRVQSFFTSPMQWKRQKACFTISLFGFT